MYENGDGGPENDAEAVRWFRLAVEQGHAAAQGSLGLMYTHGVGVPQDYVAAHMWLNLAGAQSSGNVREAAAKGRDAVAARMTSEQIAEAQRLAREWEPTVSNEEKKNWWEQNTPPGKTTPRLRPPQPRRPGVARWGRAGWRQW